MKLGRWKIFRSYRTRFVELEFEGCLINLRIDSRAMRDKEIMIKVSWVSSLHENQRFTLREYSFMDGKQVNWKDVFRSVRAALMYTHNPEYAATYNRLHGPMSVNKRLESLGLQKVYTAGNNPTSSGQ